MDNKTNEIENAHGGKRRGAGRKKGSGAFGEETKVMRIPVSQVSIVKDYLQQLKNQPTLAKMADLYLPTESPSNTAIPLFSHKVIAGFPSPADDYVEKHLDLNEQLIRNQNATFMLKVQGDSMQNAGITDGDILIVDRSQSAQSGKVVIAAVNGELTVKRLQINHQGTFLLAENPDYPPIQIHEETEMVIWGVVTSCIHQF